MSFQQALSGLNAASRGLEVIGNNIANAGTIGAKSGRAEFSDVYASSVGSASAAPMGVTVATVSQSFAQGNITQTGNVLDMAINGSGFFQVTQRDGSAGYARNGQFKADASGFIVDNAGNKLMGYATDASGMRTSSSAVPLQLPSGAPIAPNRTGQVNAEFNLDARATTATPPSSTTLTAYDSQGMEVPVSLYFAKTGTANEWEVRSSSNGGALTAVGTLVFDAAGQLTSTRDAAGAANGKSLNIPLTGNGGAAATWNAAVDFTGCTQMGASFGVTQLKQDGWAPGQLSNISIDEKGVINARYSNGQTQAAGQVMLANFRNPQGLSPLGGSLWGETLAAGQATRGAPGEGNLGALQSGALEESNIDLTAELVSMMTAQRSYQANAQTIKTMDQLMSTLMNLR